MYVLVEYLAWEVLGSPGRTKSSFKRDNRCHLYKRTRGTLQSCLTGMVWQHSMGGSMAALNGREHGKYGCVQAAASGMCSSGDLDGLRAASRCSGEREVQPQWVRQWSELTGVETLTARAVQQGRGGAQHHRGWAQV